MAERQGMDQSDWLLRALVEMVNAGDIRIGVTLAVGGVLVSGQLVGGRRYFAGVAEEFASVIPDREQAAALRRFLDRRAGAVYTGEGRTRPATPNFVHLRNARFFHPSGEPIPTNRGVWWRGRLEAVDGWCLGVLSAGDGPRQHVHGHASTGREPGRMPTLDGSEAEGAGRDGAVRAEEKRPPTA